MKIPTDWTFKDEHVANSFDRHVREQLPWYELATGAASHIARHYLSENGLVYDIGASTGNIGLSLQSTLNARNAKLIAIEPAQEMADIYKGPGELVVCNGNEVDYESFDVAICFLVLMFMTKSERALLLDKLQAFVKPGGAIIIVDKLETYKGYLGTVIHRLTLAGKVASGVSAEEIIAKELSLPGVQRPLAETEIPEIAKPFLRFGEFAGWVIEG